MTTQISTRDRLLFQARCLFWARGYSNVSTREVTKAAGVDVALISRYFGSKLGLFEATLEDAFVLSDQPVETVEGLVDLLVRLFVEAPRDGEVPTSLRMILTNAHDAEVGELVQGRFRAAFEEGFVRLIGDEGRAALFVAVLFGISVAEKSVHLPGIAPPNTPEYEEQLRHMLEAALNAPPQGAGGAEG